MSDTWKKWKRGLLKAWLALSLLWAVGLTIFAVTGTLDLLEGADHAGLLIALLVFYVLPLGALPCFVVLLLGWSITAILDRTVFRR